MFIYFWKYFFNNESNVFNTDYKFLIFFHKNKPVLHISNILKILISTSSSFYTFLTLRAEQ